MTPIIEEKVGQNKFRFVEAPLFLKQTAILKIKLNIFLVYGFLTMLRMKMLAFKKQDILYINF